MGAMRVLVVDGDVDRRGLVKLCVRLLGHTADAAYTTEEALEALAAQTYDLVVIDPPTPGPTALEAVLTIRARWPDPRRPAVVVISIDLDEPSRAALLSAGALDAIAEPPRFDRLREILAKSKYRG